MPDLPATKLIRGEIVKKICMLFALMLAVVMAGCSGTAPLTIDFKDPQSVAKGIVAALDSNKFNRIAHFYSQEDTKKAEENLAGMKAFLALRKAAIKTDDDRRWFDLLNNMTVNDVLWSKAGGWDTELVAKKMQKTYTVKSAQLVSILPDNWGGNKYISCIKMDVKWSDGAAETFIGAVRLKKDDSDGKYYIGVGNNLRKNMSECKQATQQ